jgi:hypothetical protein
LFLRTDKGISEEDEVVAIGRRIAAGFVARVAARSVALSMLPIPIGRKIFGAALGIEVDGRIWICADVLEFNCPLILFIGAIGITVVAL